MFRSPPKRAVIAWLVGLLGPAPPPPRRYFSKSWNERVRRPADFGRPCHCQTPPGTRRLPAPGTPGKAAGGAA
jgi:hypothetical protein